MAKANQASPNRQYEKKSLTKLNSFFKTIRIKHNPQTSDNSLQKIFYTSRRLRKDLGPIKGKPYIDLSYNQMIAALMMPKYWNRLEVQSSVEFLLASILFVIGSIGELQQQLPFKALFMAGSIMFLLGGLTQLWQTIRAWLRYQNHILVNFNLGLIGVVTAKAGTVFFQCGQHQHLAQSQSVGRSKATSRSRRLPGWFNIIVNFRNCSLRRNRSWKTSFC